MVDVSSALNGQGQLESRWSPHFRRSIVHCLQELESLKARLSKGMDMHAGRTTDAISHNLEGALFQSIDKLQLL